MVKQNNPLKNMPPEDDFYPKAIEHLKKHEFAAARPYLEKSLKQGRSPRALQDLAVVNYVGGKMLDAVALLQEAVEIDPSWHQPYANLYKIMRHIDNVPDSLKYCALAIKHGPDVGTYKEDFIRIAQSVVSIGYDPLLKEALVSVLRDYPDNHQEILNLWLSLLGADPSMLRLRELAFAKDYAEFEKIFSQLMDIEFLTDPFFIWGLRRLLVAGMTFEKFITHLRRALLEKKDSNFEMPLLLIEALAEYCFQAEYIMSVAPEEQKQLDALNERILKAPKPRDICILGCYKPLFTLANASEIENLFSKNSDLQRLISIQVSAPLAERKLRETIPTFTVIKDKISAEVRGQYEEFPYPRWKSLTKMYANEFLAVQQFGEAHSVLNAGCGTGRHALSYAAQLPKTDMLAIDLSLSSISYAKREAQERGIKNISFMQGDILDVSKIGRSFDLVQCTGVLHHMRDPMEGWRALVGVVKPGGLMRIALYSEAARKDLVVVQKIIVEKGYANDTAGMKRFREDADKILPTDIAQTLFSIPDFYSLSQCRDLLFHVQELRFDIPKLKKSLKELDLEFLGFSLSADIMDKFSKQAPDFSNLDLWDKFEKANPYTFQAMYQFWCRKI